MVDNVSRLSVEVNGEAAARDVDKITTSFKRLQNAVNRAGASFSRLRSGTVSAFGKMRSASATMFKGMRSGFNIVRRLSSSFITTFKLMAKVGLLAAGAFTIFAKGVLDSGNQINKFVNTLVILKGNTKEATEELDILFKLANKLGTSFVAAAGPFTKFAAAAAGALSDQSIRDVFEAFSTVGVALQLTQSEVTGVFLALQQIASKGVVSMEELRLQLAERVPGAMRLAAQSMGLTMKDFEEAVRDRTINAGEFLEKFAQKLKETFGLAAELASQRLFAQIQRLGNELLKFRQDIFASGFEEGLKTLVASATNFLKNNPELSKALGQFSKGIFEDVASFLDKLDSTTVINILNQVIGAFESLINALRTLAFEFQKIFGGSFKPVLSDIKATSHLINQLIGERAQLEADVLTGQRFEETFFGFGQGKTTLFSEDELTDKQLELNVITVKIALMREELERARAKVEDLGLEIADLPESPFEILKQSTARVTQGDISLPRIEPLPPRGEGLNFGEQPDVSQLLTSAQAFALDEAERVATIKMPEFYQAIIDGRIRQGMEELAVVQMDINALNVSQVELLGNIISAQDELAILRSVSDPESDATALNNATRELTASTEEFLAVQQKLIDLEAKRDAINERRQRDLDKLLTFSEELERSFTSVRDAVINSIKKIEDGIVQFITTGKLNFKDLANSIISELTRIAVQAFITRFILGPLLAGFSDSTGSALGGKFDFTTGQGAQGVPITQQAHSGGISGQSNLAFSGFDALRANEQPIIVERGEGIFTTNQMNALAPISTIVKAMNSSQPRMVESKNPNVNVKVAATKVEVINNTSSEAEVETTTQSDGSELIRVIIGAVSQDIAGDGTISRTLRGKFGLKNVTGLR